MLNPTLAVTNNPVLGAALLSRVILAEIRRMSAVPQAARELAVSAWEAASSTNSISSLAPENPPSKPTAIVDHLLSESLRRLDEAIQYNDLDAVLVRHAKQALPKAVAAAMLHVVRR